MPVVRLTARGQRHLADAQRVVAAVEREAWRRLGIRRLRGPREMLRAVAEPAGDER